MLRRIGAALRSEPGLKVVITFKRSIEKQRTLNSLADFGRGFLSPLDSEACNCGY
jgi:hypothetical protein